jgi:hypothetical protein
VALKIVQIGDLVKGIAYQATGGFDPTAWVKHPGMIQAKMTRRKSEAGDETFLCAYTGVYGRLIHDKKRERYRVDGVFSPARITDDRNYLEYLLSFRNGNPGLEDPRTVKVSVREITPPTENPVSDLASGSRSTADIVAETLDRIGK